MVVATAKDPSSQTQRTVRIALAGNPNSGKTTIFNALTGLRHKVANYPGVTVEKKEGRLHLDGIDTCTVLDLPGIYSLSGNSLDEHIATRALLGQIKSEPCPDLIIAVVDASNLERNLYLTSQLKDLGIPMIVALNMIDLAEKHGISVKVELLARALDLPVVAVCAKDGRGMQELRQRTAQLVQHPASPRSFVWLSKDSEFLKAALELGQLDLGEAPAGAAFVHGCNLLSESVAASAPAAIKAHSNTAAALRQGKIDPLSFEATERYRWINQVVKSSSVTTNPARRRLSERLDALTTHKIFGTLIFALVMFVIFQAIFLWATLPMEFIDQSVARFGNFLGELLPNGDLRSLLVDGVVAGVGSVLVFIPQIAILFFFLGLLEDSGYLSRAAFLMDRIMRKFGLQGRSFIPLLSSFACAIPGIMSTRTIPSFADRLATILIAPLMSCSARLPVYALLIAAFIPATHYMGFISLQGMVLLGMYLLGIVGAAGVALILKRTLLRGEPAIFVMELPLFRMPSFKTVLRDVLDRVILFIKNAGTIILACSVVLWFLASYPKGDIKETFAGRIGHFMEPVIEPLGYNWEIGVGLLASFAAREVFVSSLSTVYNLEKGDDTTQSLIQALKTKRTAGTFTPATALSLMVFFVFACQCMSTLAVCRRETGSWSWTVFMFTYMTALAYMAALITFKLAAMWS